MTGPAAPKIIFVLIHVLLVFLFVALVLFLRAFKPEAAGFEQKGPFLLLYHLSRLGLACFITILCYSAGYRAIELLRGGSPGLFNSARKTFILCFFLGASLYGIAFTLLGLAGLIRLETGLVFTIPVLLLCYRPLSALKGALCEAELRQPFLDTDGNPFFVRFVMLMTAGTALAFLLTRVVYIPVFDPNIWEHYVHYYRAVLASGSTQPNEVWHHFYASKAAGLILLANVLSDFFGAQLVSACFVIVAGVIILDLLLDYCRSTSWAFFGAMLFFTFLAGQVSDGATFKHHGVLLGYASFALWGSVSLQQATASQFRPLMIVLVTCLIYLGFYLPVATVLFAVAFLLLALTNVMLRARSHVYSFLVLAGGLCAGSALAFMTNWILTGLAEVTPMRWLWAIADQAKVEEVFGTGGVEFFLARNNDLRKEYDWSLRRAWTVLRYPLPTAIVYSCLVGILIVLIPKRVRKTVAEADRFLAYVAAFILPLSAFAQAVQTAAVDRMALYSIVFTTMASVVMLKRLVDTSIGFGIWNEPLEGMVISEKRSVNATNGIRFWRVATTVIIVVGMGWAVMDAWKDTGRRQRPIIYQYASGGMSLKEAFHKVESVVRNPRIGISVAAMAEFRKTIRPDERILRLSYDTGFSYALPGEGMVSEPTYSLIRNPRTILAEKPNVVAAYLKERRIKYLALNLQGNLFSTIAFTSLFDVREMPRYFSLAYEDGDVFILTWREQEQEQPLSDYLLTVFELKRTGVLHYPFTPRFDKLFRGNSNHRVDSVAAFERTRDEFLENLDRAFEVEMLPLVSLETSRAVLDRIREAGKDAVTELDPRKAEGRLRSILDANTNRRHVSLAEKSWERELEMRFLRLFRNAIYKEYVAELGSEVASLSLHCDERVPFAMNYPTDASCY